MSAEEDAAIERATKLRPIDEVAASLGLTRADLDSRGDVVAKVRLEAAASGDRPRGKLVLVTAATPTVHGEGKTLTAIGLADALARAEKRAVVALREPSMGPVFGAKGCATGGGRAQVAPREGINLHFTRDFDAVAAAQNLIVALVDAHVFHGNRLGIDPARVVLPRALDVNDRQLRHITSGLGGAAHGVPREDGFVITAATETMAILALASDLADLKARVSKMTVAYDRAGAPVTVGMLGATGAAAVLLKGALRPNLVQTLEGTPALVHAGPFANIAHGTSSLAAARVGLATADIVVTEAGFGADLGAEKFVDLVVASTGLPLDLAVLVVTVRALAHHGPTLEPGLANLDAHLLLLERLGVRVVVALNR
ncbi:MAG: formate--tetrahydrofolate ligase, partial [Thermoplasmatota archaeon]